MQLKFYLINFKFEFYYEFKLNIIVYMSCRCLIILPFISGDPNAEIHLILPRKQNGKDRYVIKKEGALLNFPEGIEFDKSKPDYIDEFRMHAYDRKLNSYFQIWIPHKVVPDADNGNTVIVKIVEGSPCICFHFCQINKPEGRNE